MKNLCILSRSLTHTYLTRQHTNPIVCGLPVGAVTVLSTPCYLPIKGTFSVQETVCMTRPVNPISISSLLFSSLCKQFPQYQERERHSGSPWTVSAGGGGGGGRLHPPTPQQTLQHVEPTVRGFPAGPVVKKPPCNARDTGSIPGPGRSHTPRVTKPMCRSW